MKPLARIFPLFLACCAFLAISCKKDLDVKSYRLPIAVAGPDAQITLPLDSFFLDGSASVKTDQEIASYEWGMILGSSTVLIRSPKLSKTMVVGLKEGINQFELRVKDVLGQLDRDTVEILVARYPYSAPKAVAGPDIHIQRPTRSVMLDGRGSYDYENDIKSYLWTYISGPASYHILNPDSSFTQVDGLEIGSYFFELTVTDSSGLFNKDTVGITLVDNLAGANPVLNIFCDLVFTSASEGEGWFAYQAYVEDMNGSFQYITDGQAWTQLSGPSNAVFHFVEDLGESVLFKVTNIIKGSYVFELGVQFYGGAFLYDTVRLEVVDQNKKGDEYIFESTWRYVNDVYETLTAQTPNRPELFYPDPAIRKIVSIKLHDAADWINISDDRSLTPRFVYVFDNCNQFMSIEARDPIDPTLADKKVLIKLKYE